MFHFIVFLKDCCVQIACNGYVQLKSLLVLNSVKHIVPDQVSISFPFPVLCEPQNCVVSMLNHFPFVL